MKIPYSLVLFCASILSINAQQIPDISKQKFFTSSVGATWQTRRDDVFTPLSFSGIGAELHLGSERISNKWYKHFDLDGSFNTLQSRTKGYNTSSYGVHYSISYIWAKRLKANVLNSSIYVGGAAFHESSMGIYLNNVNNIFSYNAPLGVAAAAYLQRPVHFFKRDWLMATQLTLPLLAYNARPSFIGFVSEDNVLKDFGIVTLNKLFRIDWRWQLDLPLSNGNRLRLQYRWQFLNDTHVGHLQMGSQGLNIASLFNMPYRKMKNEK